VPGSPLTPPANALHRGTNDHQAGVAAAVKFQAARRAVSGRAPALSSLSIASERSAPPRLNHRGINFSILHSGTRLIFAV
jgi:hypothetical protein